MFFAGQHEELIEKLIIVDMGMKAYPPHHSDIIAGIKSLNLDKYTARSQADEDLKKSISSYSVRQFLLKNLYWKEKGKLAWRMNVSLLEKEMPSILEAFQPDKSISIPTLFIKGALSNYILEEDWSSIEDVFIDAQLDIIEDAGHWIHAEQPEAFINAVLSFCLR